MVADLRIRGPTEIMNVTSALWYTTDVAAIGRQHHYNPEHTSVRTTIDV